MTKRIGLISTLVLLMLCSCGDTQNEYTVGVTYFIFENSTHQDVTLSSAMSTNSPGIFCHITKTTSAGVTYFSFNNNQGASSKSIANAVDLRRSSLLGYNNGIIVGFGNLDNPAVFYAYDNQCPNCFSHDAIPVRNYSRTMSSNGIATCKTCGREYNMNTGGNIIKGDTGNKLIRYHAATTGALGVLIVN